MTVYISDYFDTTNAGPKTSPESYSRIAEQTSINPLQTTFYADRYQELEAAQAAGMKAVAVVRPGNEPLPEDCEFKKIKDFNEQ